MTLSIEFKWLKICVASHLTVSFSILISAQTHLTGSFGHFAVLINIQVDLIWLCFIVSVSYTRSPIIFLQAPACNRV